MSTSHTSTIPTYSITSKQYEILLLLYRFRFLSRIHIQHFLHHKNHTRIIPWLNSLTQQQLIGRIYSNTFGENTKPAVYYLTPQSRKLLKQNEKCSLIALKHVYVEYKRSEQFRAQCLFIVDVYFALQTLAESNNSVLHFFTQTDLIELDYLPQPLPHAYVAIEEQSGEISRYFFEVITEDTPRFAMRHRIKQYVEYAESQQWETATKHSFPKIMLICPDERTQKFLLKFTARLAEENDELSEFYVANKQVIQQQKRLTKEIWTKIDQSS